MSSSLVSLTYPCTYPCTTPGTTAESFDFSEDCFGGFHRYCLEQPYHLDHVSPNLCALLGYSAQEIDTLFGGKYSQMVCEADRDAFLRFLDALAQKEQTLAIRYQMNRKDGTTIQICDITTSHQLSDGKMYGFSVISDASQERAKRSPGDLVSSILPYGFLQCTCEKYPRVTYINQALCEYLNLDRDQDRWQKSSKENIYFMLPFEERDQFRLYLEKALNSTSPIQVNHSLFRSDGSRIRLCGWLSLVTGESGQQEFALLYRPMEEDPDQLQPVQDTTFFPVLERCYNIIFELDLEASMATCIHGLENSPVGSLYGVQMALDSAKNFWINNYILPEDRSMLRAYLNQVCDPLDDWNGRSVLQADFRVSFQPSDKARYRLIGVAVHLSPTRVLLCCREITHLTYGGAQEQDSNLLHRLYDWMDHYFDHQETYTGFLLLEDTNEICSVLYASPAVRTYLGLEIEENQLQFPGRSLQEYLDSAAITRETFDRLVADKQLYFPNKNNPKEQIRLSCTTQCQDNRMLYIILCFDGKEDLPENSNKRVFARTFGHFDLFLDGTPITFSSNKEKELMALLIDRNGGTLSTSEAISYLWEDEAADERVSARYRKLAMGLKRTLEKYGIGDILINHNGVRSIDVSAIRCDYYEYLAGNDKYRQTFRNVYMTDYSWGEETLASLFDDPYAI